MAMDKKEKDLIKKIILFALPFIGLAILLLGQYIKGQMDLAKHREELFKDQKTE